MVAVPNFSVKKSHHYIEDPEIVNGKNHIQNYFLKNNILGGRGGGNAQRKLNEVFVVVLIHP